MKVSVPIAILVLLITSCAVTPPAQPFTVGTSSASYKAGDIEAYFDNDFLKIKLKKRDVAVSYFPDDDAVCLQFKILNVDCRQYWSRAGRNAFTAALEQFKTDYEQKRLEKQTHKTSSIYGSAQGYFTWKMLKFTSLASGSPEIKLGYYLRDNAAFFATTQESVDYKLPDENRVMTYGETIVYFTRAQAEALTTLFNQDYLEGLRWSTVTDREGLDGY